MGQQVSKSCLTGGVRPIKDLSSQDGVIRWGYVDAVHGLFSDSLNGGPFQWSKSLSFTSAIHQLKEAKQEEDEDNPRQICLDFIGDERDEPWVYDNVAGAMKQIMKYKRVIEKLEEGDRMKETRRKFKESFGKSRPDIKHVVVLMLENRTFDGVQGDYMNERYKKGEVKRSNWDKDGKDLYSYTNPVVNEDDNKVYEFPVWSIPRGDPSELEKANMKIPAGPAGPVEKYQFLNRAVFHKPQRADGEFDVAYGITRPTEEDVKKNMNMKGFAQQYYLKELANPLYNNPDGLPLAPQTAATCFVTKHSPVMYVYNVNQACVLRDIMDNFGCSDCHFSSAPCQTWPNRLFASNGTCFGYYNNIPYLQPADEEEPDETCYRQCDDIDKFAAFEKISSSYDSDTIFHKLSDNGVSWGIYQGQVSLAVVTTKLKFHLPSISDKVHTLEDFAADCANDELPQYCWLEPNYDAADPAANDMHPPANILNGEKLIKDVYNSLRANETVWQGTLFIVTCDEGVGSFDHVKPPAAVDPVVGEYDHHYFAQDDGRPDQFTTDNCKGGPPAANPFTRFGTRVPNLLMSPFIKPKSVIRPIGHDQDKAPYPFDHTSILRTVQDLFLGDPTEHLTERDKNAPSFIHALEPGIVNMGPKSLYCPDFALDLDERTPHTCHSMSFVQQLADPEGACLQVPHAMKSTFQNDLAAFFGM